MPKASILEDFNKLSILMQECYEKAKKLPDSDSTIHTMQKTYIAFDNLWEKVSGVKIGKST